MHNEAFDVFKSKIKLNFFPFKYKKGRLVFGLNF